MRTAILNHAIDKAGSDGGLRVQNRLARQQGRHLVAGKLRAPAKDVENGFCVFIQHVSRSPKNS